jgi:hypothetical protein
LETEEARKEEEVNIEEKSAVNGQRSLGKRKKRRLYFGVWLFIAP